MGFRNGVVSQSPASPQAAHLALREAQPKKINEPLKKPFAWFLIPMGPKQSKKEL